MPEKLLTLQELSEYLGVTEEKITELVDKKVIVAYRLGGELLRFRKDQIDAIRSELDSRFSDADRVSAPEAHKRFKERLEVMDAKGSRGSFIDTIADFFYFSDFYIVSAILIVILLIVIIRT